MKNRSIVLLISVFFILAGVLTLVASCATVDSGGSAAAEQAIRQSLDDYGRMLKSKDIEGWLALHTEDVWKMPQDSLPTIGIENLRNRITKGMSISDTVEFKVDIKEVITFGDYGYAMGYYWKRAKIRETGKDLPNFEGKFLTVFQQQPNGKWLILRDIYSSNIPSE